MKALTAVKTKATSAYRKACGMMAAAMTGMMLLPVHADGEFGSQKANFTATSPKEMINAIIGLVLDVAMYLGMVVAVYGVIKIIIAYKDDNANEITNGVRFAIVGLALVAIRAVLKGMGFISD